jgi:adenosylcobinamide-GDP ribazoletransferase
MLRALVAAFGFLTRLPLPGAPVVTGPDLGRAVGLFPVVGVALGLVVTGLGNLLVGSIPELLAAVLMVALLAALTGALHLDGLADLFDGLAGGRGDRERVLAIMRDSRIGAQGAAALVLVLAAKVAAVAAALEGRDLVAVLVFPVVGRWAVVPLIVLYRPARAEGMAFALRPVVGTRELILATATLVVVALALGPAMLVGAGVALGLTLLLGLWLQARLGGLTGDVYGAAIELAEVASLVTATAWRW